MRFGKNGIPQVTLVLRDVYSRPYDRLIISFSQKWVTRLINVVVANTSGWTVLLKLWSVIRDVYSRPYMTACLSINVIVAVTSERIAFQFNTLDDLSIYTASIGQNDLHIRLKLKIKFLCKNWDLDHQIWCNSFWAIKENVREIFVRFKSYKSRYECTFKIAD